MTLVIPEAESFVELMAAKVEMIGFKMQSLDPQMTAGCDRKFHRLLPDALSPALGHNVELVDEAIAAVEFEREPEAEHHISDQVLGIFTHHQATKIFIMEQPGDEFALSGFVIGQALKEIKIPHQGKQSVDVFEFGEAKRSRHTREAASWPLVLDASSAS